MRAVVYDRYGPPEVLRTDSVDQPVPKETEVRIKIHATSVTRTDIGLRAGKPFLVRFFFGLLRPKRPILGTELAGEVDAVGPGVKQFVVGDHVFGSTPNFRTGTYAEYICLEESAPIAHKPARMTFEEAAAVTDGMILALMCLEAGMSGMRSASSSTVRQVPSAQPGSSSPGTSAPMSPRSALPRMSSW
jgi:NADPH:quinone reductase-like Zn-dependent oxidoreductase